MSELSIHNLLDNFQYFYETSDAVDNSDISLLHDDSHMTHSNGNQVTDEDIDMAYNSTVDMRELLHGQCVVSIVVSRGIF
jgi:hypothetical protein